MMTELTLIVNGTQHTLDVPQSRTLAEVLRYDLGLTGTKIGCAEAECGICTVHVDGVPTDSCIYPAFKAQGRSITTIEGLAQADQLHPLQSAFIDHGAVQCGFCTPGLIMRSKSRSRILTAAALATPASSTPLSRRRVPSAANLRSRSTSRK